MKIETLDIFPKTHEKIEILIRRGSICTNHCEAMILQDSSNVTEILCAIPCIPSLGSEFCIRLREGGYKNIILKELSNVKVQNQEGLMVRYLMKFEE
jgi:hypothetical protein